MNHTFKMTLLFGVNILFILGFYMAGIYQNWDMEKTFSELDLLQESDDLFMLVSFLIGICTLFIANSFILAFRDHSISEESLKDYLNDLKG